jgi:hypothetical protein
MLLVQYFIDERVWDSTQPKSATEDGRVRSQVFNSFRGGWEDFIDLVTTSRGGKCPGYESPLL